MTPRITTAIPTHVDALTPEWLTTTLRAAGHAAPTVTHVTSEPVGSGQMAGSYRLSLTYAEPGPLPKSMVAKLAIGERHQREFASGVFRKEVLFYTRIAPTLAVPVPRCHAAVISEEHTEFVLLLDDMTPAVQGDQIAGCTPEHARAVAVAAAGLHGPRWCDPTLLELPGLVLPTHEDRELMDSVLTPMADAFRARFTLDDKESATIDWLVATAGDWLERPPTRFAMIHGDLRIDNVLFGPDDTVTVVDWQTITPGNPLRDIAFLVVSSLEPEERRAHERDIVAAYHSALLGFGVSDYTFADCWRDYVDSLIQSPLIIVFGCGAAIPTERGDRMFATMLTRTAAAIDDLNPDALQ
ncbi:phosphotransferase [Gordonia sp. NPDC003424]